ncbi:MAG: ribonuclease HI family protein [Patescibacteria group bacterium]
MSSISVYTVYTDGGSRGNPGPAAAGYVIEGPDIRRTEQGHYLGVQTNNVAEYSAAILALNKLKTLIGAERARAAHVRVMADSELLVRQVNGEYKVRDAGLKKLFVDLYNARQDFAKISFTHVRREHNKDADAMVNEALDRQDSPKLEL